MQRTESLIQVKERFCVSQRCRARYLPAVILSIGVLPIFELKMIGYISHTQE